jgi:hypothetical protein
MKRNPLKPSEHQIQTRLMDYLAFAGREDLHWFAVPNGEKRHIRSAVRLKAEGVKRGTPDICVMLPEGKVAWLEMKAEKGRLSSAQIYFRDLAARLGHHWGCASSVDEALSLLTKWDVLKPAYRYRAYSPFGIIGQSAETTRAA